MSEERGIVLPKVYKAEQEKYEKYNGLPKLSYSQIGSFTDPLYKNDYIRQYFFGEKQEGGIFAIYGSQCGEWWETGGKVVGDMLSESDIEVLKKLPRPDGAQYEYEIVVELDTDEGKICVQGFIDQLVTDGKDATVIDLKTGNLLKKKDFYGGDEYQQTTLYSYHMETEGYNIKESKVFLVSRKGNGRGVHVLRLDGPIETIPTPYSKERAEKYFEKVRKTAKEISDLYKVYLKVNK
jgi:hypothetical protein